MKEIFKLSYHPIEDNVFYQQKLDNFEKKIYEIGKYELIYKRASYFELEKMIEK